jgi:hypothetical protein
VQTQNSELRTQNSQRVIRASDLAQYAYCARAWWLGSVKGTPSANVRELQQGEAAHQSHGRRVWASSALVIAAVVLMILALIVVIIW